MERRRCNKGAVNGVERYAVLGRVRRRLAFVRLRQLILCMPERMQLRRLLGEQQHQRQKQALQRARALIEDKRHRAILDHPAEMRYLTRHCFRP